MNFDCVSCKGGKNLCKRNYCPIYSKLSTKTIKFNKDEFFGGSPPSVFVGSKLTYPNVNVGILSVPDFKEEVWAYDDVKYWVENKTFSEDETATRFHHRLVSIHLFPNGNGRYARLITDIFLENILNKPRFTWGNANLVKSGDDRTRYIQSLSAADRGEYEQLLEFVRS